MHATVEIAILVVIYLDEISILRKMSTNKVGQILWHDLTVPDATGISDFYQAVVGWEREGLSMGDYEDYIIKNPSAENEVVAGICHSKGVNADLPAQWLMYVTVENLEHSLETCQKKGGKIIGQKRKMGEGWYCLIQDPAGAYVMLSQVEEKLDEH